MNLSIHKVGRDEATSRRAGDRTRGKIKAAAVDTTARALIVNSGQAASAMSETFSFYGLRSDASVAAWDFLSFADELAAERHATTMVGEYPDVETVEVWSLRGFRLAVRAPASETAQSASRIVQIWTGVEAQSSNEPKTFGHLGSGTIRHFDRETFGGAKPAVNRLLE